MTTPEYYRTPVGDLYDLFAWKFGVYVLRAHIKMSAIEYVWREDRKGQDDDIRKAHAALDRLLDEPSATPALSAKVVELWCQANGYGLVRSNGPEPATPRPAAERFTNGATQAGRGDGPLADEETTNLLEASRRKNAAFMQRQQAIRAYANALGEPLDSVEMGAIHDEPSTAAAPAFLPPSQGASILQAAIAYWEDARQRSILTDAMALDHIKSELAAKGWPAHLHYHSHAAKLHEELPALFPVVPRGGAVAHED